MVCAYFNKGANAQETMVTEISYPFLEKLINTAKENYPRMKSYQSKVNFAKGAISKAKLSWFDAFTFSYIYQPNNTLNLIDPTFFNGYQAGITLNIGTVIQKPFNVKQAREEFKIAENDQQEYDLTLTTEVKRRYFTYIQALISLRVGTKSVQDAESILKSVTYKFEKSEETFDNYNKTLLTVSTLIQGKIEAEALFFIAKSSLEELLVEKIENIN